MNGVLALQIEIAIPILLTTDHHTDQLLHGILSIDAVHTGMKQRIVVQKVKVAIRYVIEYMISLRDRISIGAGDFIQPYAWIG